MDILFLIFVSLSWAHVLGYRCGVLDTRRDTALTVTENMVTFAETLEECEAMCCDMSDSCSAATWNADEMECSLFDCSDDGCRPTMFEEGTTLSLIGDVDAVEQTTTSTFPSSMTNEATSRSDDAISQSVDESFSSSMSSSQRQESSSLPTTSTTTIITATTHSILMSDSSTVTSPSRTTQKISMESGNSVNSTTTQNEQRPADTLETNKTKAENMTNTAAENMTMLTDTDSTKLNDSDTLLNSTFYNDTAESETISNETAKTTTSLVTAHSVQFNTDNNTIPDVSTGDAENDTLNAIDSNNAINVTENANITTTENNDNITNSLNDSSNITQDISETVENKINSTTPKGAEVEDQSHSLLSETETSEEQWLTEDTNTQITTTTTSTPVETQSSTSSTQSWIWNFFKDSGSTWYESSTQESTSPTTWSFTTTATWSESEWTDAVDAQGNVGTFSEDMSANEEKLSVVMIVTLSLGIFFVFIVFVVIGQRLFHGWQRRHYNKLDYLINGIYN